MPFATFQDGIPPGSSPEGTDKNGLGAIEWHEL